jgi:rubrerythrin
MTAEDPTQASLREAFAREAQSALRCLYFARRADVDGRADVAALLRSLAEGGHGHGFGHLEFMEEFGDPLAGGGDTAANVENAIAEAEGNAAAYDDFAEAARGIKAADVADWFAAIAEAKRAHAAQLRNLLPPRREAKRRG